jgi:hypothetical protein
VLQVKTVIRRALLRTITLGAVGCVFALPTAPPVIPLTVCEVLHDLPAQNGKDIAVLGRYSFREKGRWISEQACPGNAPEPAAVPPTLWLIEDTNSGPRPPADFQLDGPVVEKKWADVQRHTELGKFRFGTPDYDRWAVIWGRLQMRKGEDAKRAAANLVYRGSGVIFFLTR